MAFSLGVEVVVLLEAKISCRFHKHVRHPRVEPRVFDAERAAGAVMRIIFGGDRLEHILRHFEVRKYVIVAPPIISKSGPVIEILAVS